MTDSPFSSLPIRTEILTSIDSLGYQSMTPVQAQSLPVLLEGQDLLAQAKTGSGKTAAFAIGLLNKLEEKTYQTQALVICPTRELADQVSQEIRRLASAIANTRIVTLCGGKPMGPQLASLKRDPHIVVGTPGRLLKHLNKDTLNFKVLKTLVLDEADRMLDMGFLEDIMRIIDDIPRQRQTLLFSATYPDEIERISRAVQKNPVDIRVETSNHNEQIKQVFYRLDNGSRSQALVAVLEHYNPESTLVFCNQKQHCQDLADELNQRGFHALALHGDLEQFDRDQVLVQFANKSASILIATDVAARGLDIDELAAVINYELSHDPEVHIHRIGRTGRAGSKGLAISLFAPSEQFRLEAIEAYQHYPAKIENMSKLKTDAKANLRPPMVTLFLNAGRKDKIRPGDLLGALTANTDLPGKLIGKINIFDKIAYVAVDQKVAKQALKILTEGKIKGRKFRARRLA
ncbi:MAG: ATP-dependent RNA helicase DbpA [Aestuariibacter sp.]|nr:ATP-dependent RNA helicase DbpA [Aestuariibacter sp.]